ncbi:hypothetical protein BDP27DRAFT_1425055 [Rhodocollybia butyracea]|uniref:BRCT domain-containing protein n=1 Tax=Rhodocollybia butyracea TaxID=206335 RepID=A0A9P5PH40_9AGAR|nr:hypothetical protein BDP27DRAFT_1425055 [Rhodocollybia butyracea]
MTPPTKRPADELERAQCQLVNGFSYIPVAPMIDPTTTAGDRLFLTNQILSAPPLLWTSHRLLEQASSSQVGLDVLYNYMTVVMQNLQSVLPPARRHSSGAQDVTLGTILGSCTVFVDVWSSDEQDISWLYKEMAEGMGAKASNVIAKVLGPRCTHFIFVDGKLSGIKKYFRMAEEKRPKVVGPSWLRECKKANEHLGEDNFLVDMDQHKPSVWDSQNRKRRRSSAPRFYDDDVSTVAVTEDNMAPLEIARLRGKKARKTN